MTDANSNSAKPADGNLEVVEANAEAKLRQAEVEAEALLHQATVDAEATLRQAEIDAGATLRQAEAEAEAKLRRAALPAAAKLLKAKAEAEAILRQAQVPAAAKLLQAEVQAEATRRQELGDPSDVFERFFELSIDMMCISSSNGYVTRASPSFDVLGYAREDMVFRPVLDLVHPDDQATTQAAYDNLVPGSPTVTFENRYRCRDGSYRWLSWASGLDATGVVYSMARDITKAKTDHDALTRAKDAVHDANRELETFSYSVAHDLRAPLRSIDGFSRALLEDYVDTLDPTGRRYLTFIRESAQQMAQLIDDLLGLSRVTRGEMGHETVDLSKLARASNGRLQAREPERAMDVQIQDGLETQGDPRLLAIMLDNLLGNAWKFTAKRADARIELGASDHDGQLVFFVRDNGAGFDMATADNLFGVFQRLHRADEFEGTGVGLATVRRIVGRHGGRIWANAAVGGGATFSFTLHEPQ